MALLRQRRRVDPESRVADLVRTTRELAETHGLVGIDTHDADRLLRAQAEVASRELWPVPDRDPELLAREMADVEERLRSRRATPTRMAVLPSAATARPSTRALMTSATGFAGVGAGLAWETYRGALVPREWWLIAAAGGLLVLLGIAAARGAARLRRGTLRLATALADAADHRRLRRLSRHRDRLLHREAARARWMHGVEEVLIRTYAVHHAHGRHARLVADTISRAPESGANPGAGGDSGTTPRNP